MQKSTIAQHLGSHSHNTYKHMQLRTQKVAHLLVTFRCSTVQPRVNFQPHADVIRVLLHRNPQVMNSILNDSTTAVVTSWTVLVLPQHMEGDLRAKCSTNTKHNVYNHISGSQSFGDDARTSTNRKPTSEKVIWIG